MIPILFSSNTTSFTTNGIGRLSDAAKCKVTEERNGSFELEMEYPIGGIHYENLVNGNIIYAKPSQGGSLQAFRIYKVTKNARGMSNIYARHISYQLSFIPVSAFEATTAASAMAGLKSHAAESCPFTLNTSGSLRAGSFVVARPDSIRAYLGGMEGSILDTYQGEFKWDNYTVTLCAARGSDKGVTIVYGKNLTDLSQETNIENTVTGIYPYWLSQGNQETDEDGNILETTTYVELPEKVVQSSRASNFPFRRSVVKDFTSEFENAPTVTELRNYTNQYISENDIGIPSVSLDVKFINLFETPGYKDVAALQTVELCDTVTVVFPKLGVSAKAKVYKTEYNVLKERYEEISIGDSKATLSSTITDGLKQVTHIPTESEMRNAIDRATGVLNSGMRGHVIINRNAEGWANEILFLDNDSINSARNVLRINMNGIGFSSTGYKGPYYQSWTNDGHMTLGGVNNNYGTLEIMDENAIPTVTVDKDGLKILAINYTGYLRNNTFYADSSFTQELPKKKNVGYYNYSNSKLYKWDGSNFVQDASASVIANMDHSGLNIKKGTIELLMDEDVGFSVDGDEIHLGNFYVSRSNRQILQSDDERTGISGTPSRTGALYFWANYKNSSNYGLVVNEAGAYCMTSDRSQRFHIGDTLAQLTGGGGGGCTSDTTCTGDSCSSDGGCYTPGCEDWDCDTCTTVGA